jgi:hypothetical protein
MAPMQNSNQSSGKAQGEWGKNRKEESRVRKGTFRAAAIRDAIRNS